MGPLIGVSFFLEIFLRLIGCFDEDELAFNAGELEKSVFIKKDSYKKLRKESIADIAKVEEKRLIYL